MECPDIVIGTPSALLGHVQAKVSVYSSCNNYIKLSTVYISEVYT